MDHRKAIFFITFYCYYLMKISTEAALSMQLSPSLKKIGEQCKRDHECITNGFCFIQKTCECDDYYFPSKDKATCHAAFGLTCKSNDTCGTMANGECSVKEKCECQKNYLLDNKNSSHCFIKPSRNGDFCQDTEECVETLGLAICDRNACKCFGSHLFINETGKCTLVKGLFQPCQHSYECYDIKRSKNLLCIEGKCAEEKNEPDEASFLVSSLLAVGLSLVFSIFLIGL